MSDVPHTPAAPGGSPCQQSQCSGQYENLGDDERYCDTCGLAPAISPAGMVSSAGTSAARTGDTGGGPTSPVSEPGASSASQASRRSVSGRLSRSQSGDFSPRSVTVRSARSTSAKGARTRLGAGLISLPEIPPSDPLSQVMTRPEVSERKRFCGNSDCGAAVGRSRSGQQGRTEGFCTRCGHPYSFIPKLKAGDVVHGQYEIAGCLAHGGLGWIYLAIDKAVADRWVVLKGLLDTGDQDAMEAAISERRFLAEIEHSTIVRIYNFVEHLDPRTGSLDGYIVMEYVGGKSLKDIANSRRTPEGRRDPLPVEQACAYGIEALDALGHLHSRNLLYCDFKIDNAIQQADQLKLIDMGAVRRADDNESTTYGTVGYQAPEVAEAGASVASDLYTVARTLAVLTFDFPGYTTIYRDSLPDPAHVEVLHGNESFYRFLVRGTDPDPQRRFASAEEMSEQLTGVLREVVALRTGQPRPALSALFGPELGVVDSELVPAPANAVSRLGARARHAGWRRWGSRRPTRALGPPATAPVPAARPPGSPPGSPRSGVSRTLPVRVRETALALPVPRVDPDDPNAGFLAGLMASAPSDLLTALRAAPTDSLECRLRELRAHLELTSDGAGPQARKALSDLTADHADDWRVVWHRGLVGLVTEDWETAALSFDALYDAFPGEVAPKLALGVCAEVLGQLDNAADYYELVWATDPSHVSAGFGLARVRLAAGDRERAVQALESVPGTSVHYSAAQVAAVRARLRQREPTEPLLPDLHDAGRRVARLRDDGLEPALGEQLSCEVLGSALDWVLAGRVGEYPPAGDQRLLDCPLDETGLRLGLEHSYRRLAWLVTSSTERIDLVEAANRFRPRTWV